MKEFECLGNLEEHSHLAVSETRVGTELMRVTFFQKTSSDHLLIEVQCMGPGVLLKYFFSVINKNTVE